MQTADSERTAEPLPYWVPRHGDTLVHTVLVEMEIQYRTLAADDCSPNTSHSLDCVPIYFMCLDRAYYICRSGRPLYFRRTVRVRYFCRGILRCRRVAADGVNRGAQL